MKQWLWAGMAVLLAACADSEQSADRRDLNPGDVVSGYSFLTPETQVQQDDDFLNPGLLWVDRGADLFASPEGVSQACIACHAQDEMSLQGAATHYPAIDEESGTLVNLEGRINLCRSRHQDAAPLDYESEDLLSLTAYVANLSRGQPTAVTMSADLQPYYDKGRDYFFTRRGQLNLSCHHCHDVNWGRQLRGDTISQGHGNGFPTYRLEWQTLGSLHRRLRDCDVGVRAEPKPYGSEDYTALELYLAIRGAGLPAEAPAVRR